jgi:hypothetical protein
MGARSSGRRQWLGEHWLEPAARQSGTPISSQIGGMMIKLPRGVQKGCGGGGGGEGGGVKIGAGMSAETKLFTGFPRTSTIRTLP